LEYNCACGDDVRRCASYIEDYAKAIGVMETLRARIPAEVVEAPGWLRDRFQFLLPHLAIAVQGDEAEAAEIQAIVDDTLVRVDKVRDEMLRRGTKYVPHNLPWELNQAVDKIEAVLTTYALQELHDCVCERPTAKV